MLRLRQPQESKGKGKDEGLDDNNDAKPLTTTFELNDTLYVKAELEETDTVYLWLGVSYLAS